ncbi:MAG: hypothetical protein ACOCYN_03835 [Planctomycetota bacterium]
MSDPMLDLLRRAVRDGERRYRSVLADYRMVVQRLRRYEPTAPLPRHDDSPLVDPALIGAPDPSLAAALISDSDADGLTTAARHVLSIIRVHPGISIQELAARRGQQPASVHQTWRRHLQHLVHLRHVGPQRRRHYDPL